MKLGSEYNDCASSNRRYLIYHTLRNFRGILNLKSSKYKKMNGSCLINDWCLSITKINVNV